MRLEGAVNFTIMSLGFAKNVILYYVDIALIKAPEATALLDKWISEIGTIPIMNVKTSI